MLNITLVKRGTEAELLLDGRLDSNAAGETEDVFTDVSARFERIVVDMEKLEYISSSGLRVLKNLHITMKKKGGELFIRNAGEAVMEVFEMTGFVALLRFI
ncbi:MAG: STAS domain-containing protein [Clostridia bacterium]|nr:STAS domain-containing protein [Clostridia bacterium]